MEITLKHGERLTVICGQDVLDIRCMALGPYDNSDIAFDVVLRASSDRKLSVHGSVNCGYQPGEHVVVRSYRPEDFEPEARGEE